MKPVYIICLVGQPLYFMRFDGPATDIPVHTADLQLALTCDTPAIAQNTLAALDPALTRYVVVEHQLTEESEPDIHVFEAG